MTWNSNRRDFKCRCLGFWLIGHLAWETQASTEQQARTHKNELCFRFSGRTTTRVWFLNKKLLFAYAPRHRHRRQLCHSPVVPFNPIKQILSKGVGPNSVLNNILWVLAVKRFFSRSHQVQFNCEMLNKSGICWFRKRFWKLPHGNFSFGSQV